MTAFLYQIVEVQIIGMFRFSNYLKIMKLCSYFTSLLVDWLSPARAALLVFGGHKNLSMVLKLNSAVGIGSIALLFASARKAEPGTT